MTIIYKHYANFLYKRQRQTWSIYIYNFLNRATNISFRNCKLPIAYQVSMKLKIEWQWEYDILIPACIKVWRSCQLKLVTKKEFALETLS